LHEKPVFTINIIADEMGTSYDNIRNIVIKLQKEGILRDNKKPRNKTYYLNKLLELLSQ